MINLRYHIVSITAVFLALGIGVALGGTFLDRYTFDILERNIGSAEARIKTTEAENRDLKSQISQADDRDQALTNVGSTALFKDQLTDVPVLVVSQPGSDKEVLTTISQSLVRAGADLRGTIEIRDAMAMTDSVNDAVAKAVDEPASKPEKVRAAVNKALRSALDEAGQEVKEPEVAPTTTTTPASSTTVGGASTDTTAPAGDASTTTTLGGEASVLPPEPEQPEILTVLLDADYLRYNPASGYDSDSLLLEHSGYRYVFVGASDPDPAMNTAMLALLAKTGADQIPVVVVTPSVVADSSAGTAPTIVQRIITDSDRANRYTTVDNVEVFTGQAATIIALRDINVAEAAHYGQASGATALLPGAP